MRRAAFASVCVALILVAIKAAAYFATGSVAMLGSLADSAVDLAASLAILYAVQQALTPADSEHRFGHGKAEPLAGLIQVAFIVGSATFLAFEAVRRFVMPEDLTQPLAGIGVIVISTILTLGLVLYQRKVIGVTGSLAVASDSLHYAGDLVTNLGVVAALVLSYYFGLGLADPLIGLAIAVVLYASAWWVLRQSLDQLMDRELPEAEREKIRRLILGVPRVRALHDLRTRSAGIQSFIQVHVEMDPALNLGQAHEVGDAVEQTLRCAFPKAEILIHIDPHGSESPPPLALS
jgi:ferrous-iron efflux pump FieF